MTDDDSHALGAYVSVLVACAAVLRSALLVCSATTREPVAVLCACSCERGRRARGVWISRNDQMSIALLPTLFAAVLFGPLAGGVDRGRSMLGDPELFRRGDPHARPRLKWATLHRSELHHRRGRGPRGAGVSTGSVRLVRFVVATLCGCGRRRGLDFFFALATSQVRRRSHARARRSESGRSLLTSFLVYAPVVAVLVSPTRGLAAGHRPFFVPTLAFQRLFALYQRERTWRRAPHGERDLAEANLSFAVALVTALEASDAYTAGHSRAVAIYCRDIAHRMGLPTKNAIGRSCAVSFTTSARSVFRRAFSGRTGR